MPNPCSKTRGAGRNSRSLTSQPSLMVQATFDGSGQLLSNADSVLVEAAPSLRRSQPTLSAPRPDDRVGRESLVPPVVPRPPAARRRFLLYSGWTRTCAEIQRVRDENFAVYDAEKVWRQLGWTGGSPRGEKRLLRGPDYGEPKRGAQCPRRDRAACPPCIASVPSSTRQGEEASPVPRKCDRGAPRAAPTGGAWHSGCGTDRGGAAGGDRRDGAAPALAGWRRQRRPVHLTI